MSADRREIIPGYDYSTAEQREITGAQLFAAAKTWRLPYDGQWKKWNDYYNFRHDAIAEMQKECEDKQLPWLPPAVPDPFIQVESQIVPTVPEPEFRGRDDDTDSVKAKQRELAVRYVCDSNRLGDMNTSNERRLVKLGDAWWKAYWDRSMRCGIHEGDIRIKDVSVEDIYPDPSVGAGDFQSGQYVCHVYKLHKVAFAQTFAPELKKLGLNVEELMNQDYQSRGGLFDESGQTFFDDTLQVMELWYRQPLDGRDADTGEELHAGAVACSIQAGGKEIKNIPNYWVNTWRQCKLFPFVHYWRIRDETGFYNKSELFAIKDLVDAADRKLAYMLLNDAFTSNDIIVVEEGALADGEELTNEPGKVVNVRQNRVGGVQRLGGLHSGADNSLISYLSEQIQRTNRNFDSNLGRETTRQTTATGLAMLRDDADTQADIKKADRLAGFERLYELIDWLCLEFFDDDRLLYIGAKNENEQAEQINYSSDRFTVEMPAVRDAISGEQVRDPWEYYPKVDVTVNAGDGIIKGKQATINALDKLVSVPVNEQNWRLLTAELEILDLPQKKEISEMWERMFAPQIPKEITDALAADPRLVQMVAAIIQAQNVGGGGNALPGMQNSNAAALAAGTGEQNGAGIPMPQPQMQNVR